MSDPRSYSVKITRIDDNTVKVTYHDSTPRYVNGVIVRRQEPTWWNSFPRYVRRELAEWWERNEPNRIESTRSEGWPTVTGVR